MATELASLNNRAIAAKILSRLAVGQSSLTQLLNEYEGSEQSALLKELCFGSCRWFHLLQSLLAGLVDKPLKERDLDIHCLLIVGLYQLREMHKAQHAVINETVAAAEQLGKPWAKALVNGVLRNYLRQSHELDNNLPESAVLSLPAWLRKQLQQQWPDHAIQLINNGNLRPPMTLRCNLARTSRERYLQALREQGMQAAPGQLADSAIYLESACDVTALPGFATGEVSIQDEASQLVPGLLELASEQRVLDACAAPGGKTCHIAESEQSLTELMAIDIDAARVARITENLQRLGLQATLKTADAGKLAEWWDGNEFDRILLDAPCSATGVIRRHPDIKLLRQSQDIPRLNEIQLELLSNLWPCLKPGGKLLYTTCSLLRSENEEIIARFLAATPDAKYESMTADWGVECRYGRQLLTGDQKGPDGFFFARLRKD